MLPILQMAGAFFAVLVLIFFVGMIWFHIVDGLLENIKRRLFPPKPAAWHTLEEAEEAMKKTQKKTPQG